MLAAPRLQVDTLSSMLRARQAPSEWQAASIARARLVAGRLRSRACVACARAWGTRWALLRAATKRNQSAGRACPHQRRWWGWHHAGATNQPQRAGEQQQCASRPSCPAPSSGSMSLVSCPRHAQPCLKTLSGLVLESDKQQERGTGRTKQPPPSSGACMTQGEGRAASAGSTCRAPHPPPAGVPSPLTPHLHPSQTHPPLPAASARQLLNHTCAKSPSPPRHPAPVDVSCSHVTEQHTLREAARPRSGDNWGVTRLRNKQRASRPLPPDAAPPLAPPPHGRHPGRLLRTAAKNTRVCMCSGTGRGELAPRARCRAAGRCCCAPRAGGQTMQCVCACGKTVLWAPVAARRLPVLLRSLCARRPRRRRRRG